MRELVCPQAGLLRVGLLRQLVHAGVDDVNVSLQRRLEELAPRLALRRQFTSGHLRVYVPRGKIVTSCASPGREVPRGSFGWRAGVRTNLGNDAHVGTSAEQQ
jgi:hypothetical protein